MTFLSKIFGDANASYVKQKRAIVEAVNALEPEYQKLTDEKLRDVSAQLKARMAEGETLDDILPEAFAAVREVARRTLGQRHFDVQILGGIALHEGKIAEMRTGEGKTLVATLPLYLNSLTGRGVHLVTPNDYLSRVGAGWMGPVYHALGVSVAVVAHELSGIYDPSYEDSTPHGDARLLHFRPVTRREAYAADITYGTNNEFGFDYLRDNLEQTPAELRQREYHFAIVDEIDSILIDEARTPLIISMPDEESADLYRIFARLTPQLKKDEDYNVDEKLRAVTITEQGIDRIEKLLGVKNIYEEKGMRFVRHLEQALRSQALFQRDRDYVVKDGAVIIVDEFTGRLMPGRRWSEGLHQAIEAKEGVAVQRESRTLATITFQNYFRMYEKLAGMTGTAQTSAEEFHKVYTLDVITIPTHRPMVRADLPDLVFRSEPGKFKAVVREVGERHKKGQPVLIGTVSIEKNERLSKMLQVEGIPHEVLNAKNHEREAMIIAQAGRRGAVTVATNMAGRGVDILLGGSPPVASEADEVRTAGGLHVIGTERHEARRIDNQLRGRAGRQGDPGSSQFLVSMEDDLMRVFGPGGTRVKSLMERFDIPEDMPIENSFVARAIESAQGKIEGFHFDSRKHVLEFDDVLNKQRETIYRLRKEVLFSSGNSKSQISNSNEDTAASSLKEKILEMIREEIERIVHFHTSGDSDEWNIKEIFEDTAAIFPVGDEVLQKLEAFQKDEGSAEERRAAIVEYLVGILTARYEEKEKEVGVSSMENIVRGVLLQSIDILWMDHLDQMEHLRDSVRLRAYGQRDPLVEYKNEGRRLFLELQNAIRVQAVNALFKVGMPIEERRATPRIQLRHDELPQFGGVTATQPQSVPSAFAKKNPHAVSIAPGGPKEPNRNDPCPCGSGKKYKKCHGA